MIKLFKIIILIGTCALAIGLSAPANAYCVYNESKFQTISVADKEHSLFGKNSHRMGRREVALHGSACCKASAKGCSQGAYISVTSAGTPIDSTKLDSSLGKVPNAKSITCKTLLPAGGTLTIYGGHTQPLMCSFK